MTVKEAIQELAATLDDRQALDVLAYIQRIVGEDSETTEQRHTDLADSTRQTPTIGEPIAEDDEQGQHERDERMAEAAKPLTYDDPLWRLIGIATTNELTDIAKNKDEYLADAFSVHHK